MVSSLSRSVVLFSLSLLSSLSCLLAFTCGRFWFMEFLLIFIESTEAHKCVARGVRRTICSGRFFFLSTTPLDYLLDSDIKFPYQFVAGIFGQCSTYTRAPVTLRSSPVQASVGFTDKDYCNGLSPSSLGRWPLAHRKFSENSSRMKVAQHYQVSKEHHGKEELLLKLALGKGEKPAHYQPSAHRSVRAP